MSRASSASSVCVGYRASRSMRRGHRWTLRLPHGGGVVALRDGNGHIVSQLHLDDWRDLGPAVQRCRRLLDLDADPTAVDHVLGADPVLAPLVAARPGLRIPGAVEGVEVAVRAIVGQQISVAGARTLTGELVRRLGKPPTAPDGTLTHQFPSPAPSPTLIRPRSGFRWRGPRPGGASSLGGGRGPGARSRRRPRRGDPGSPRSTWDRSLDDGLCGHAGPRRPGRAPGDRCRHPAGVRSPRASSAPGPLAEHAERWRPWRSYALQHLWASLATAPGRKETDA